MKAKISKARKNKFWPSFSIIYNCYNFPAITKITQLDIIEIYTEYILVAIIIKYITTYDINTFLYCL